MSSSWGGCGVVGMSSSREDRGVAVDSSVKVQERASSEEMRETQSGEGPEWDLSR